MPDKNEQDFVELLRTGVNKASYRIGVRSREIFGASKLRIQAEVLKNRRSRAFQDLGRKVHDLYGKGSLTPEEVGDDCTFIDSVNSQISELEEQIDRIHEQADQEIRDAEQEEEPGAEEQH